MNSEPAPSNVFDRLAEAAWTDTTLADRMEQMVGFRNIAVHDDQALQRSITVSILRGHPDDFLAFTVEVLKRR
jgi:uncharacterized protein YutE (UPF0331/DUF86 family)